MPDIATAESAREIRDVDDARTLLILGTRGIPAGHGGFETFAQQFSIHLVQHGWNVGVYCQERLSGSSNKTSSYHSGVERLSIASRNSGSFASISYDFKCVVDALRRPGTILLLGYNTAIFAVILRLLGRTIIINMDGLEWRRPKWSRLARTWLWMNERIAAKLGHVLIADHPAICAHLATFARRKKLVMIPYGADAVETAPTKPLLDWSLAPSRYFVCISRIEPENSHLELVTAFSARKRGFKLVVLGKINTSNAYHKAVLAAASDEVQFTGAIYDKDVLASLRFYARAYCHGHTVGGTNPSLVEALGAGCATIAHNNEFNRWTAGDDQFFFSDITSCEAMFDLVCRDDVLVANAKDAARRLHRQRFQTRGIMDQYERLVGFDWQTYCEAEGQRLQARKAAASLETAGDIEMKADAGLVL